jgi:hypothetical protein
MRGRRERSPALHEQRPLSHQLAAAIGSLNAAFDDVGKRHFGHVARCLGAFGDPITEGTAANELTLEYRQAARQDDGSSRISSYQ